MGFILGPCPSCACLPDMHLLAIWPFDSLTPFHPSPLWQEFQHSQWPPRPPAAAVSMSRGCAGVPSKAETLPLSYQTTPDFASTPSLSPLPPLTHIAHVPCGQRYAFRMAVGGAAAGPTNLFFLPGAGDPVVGHGGGGYGRLLRGPRALLWLRFPATPLFRMYVGGRGLTRTLDRRIVSHIVCTQMFI